MKEADRLVKGNAWPNVSDAIRRTMKGNMGKDTIPELALRSTLHAMGYRYRIHRRDLPGTPDIVFLGRLKAVWLHGCFWHSHQGCRYATTPKTRADYWVPKLVRNRERDAEHLKRLSDMGWKSVVVWECELKDLEAVRTRLRDFLGPNRLDRSTAPEP
jgi:DNA mismatch endonuclease (patch repair protein)